MRIELAKILLQKPDVMLLDEPTNHLDIESIIWLENWLQKFNGALILVSHDRKFLDSVTNRTVEIAFGKLNDYKAAYSKYVTLRKDRIEKQIQAKKNQDKFIEETKVLINKFRSKVYIIGTHHPISVFSISSGEYLNRSITIDRMLLP